MAFGVSIHDSTDFGQLRPALEQIKERYGKNPRTVLADCGFCDKADISFAHEQGVTAIVPSNNEARLGDLAYATDYRNSMPGIAQWRERMVKAATKETYKLRQGWSAFSLRCVTVACGSFGYEASTRSKARRSSIFSPTI